MPNAIGVIEVSLFTNALVVLDEMLKTSDVQLISCHKRLGGRLVHLVISGSTSAVEAAVNAANMGKESEHKNGVKVAVTISNPHPEILRMIDI